LQFVALLSSSDAMKKTAPKINFDVSVATFVFVGEEEQKKSNKVFRFFSSRVW